MTIYGDIKGLPQNFKIVTYIITIFLNGIVFLIPINNQIKPLSHFMCSRVYNKTPAVQHQEL